MLNTVLLMGRLTDDPRPRYTTEGNTIASFSLAVPSYDGKSTMFVDCQCFGKTADFAVKYCNKGLRIVVQGRLDCGTYDVKDNDGNTTKKFFSRVVCNAIDFADSKPKKEEQPKEDKKEDFIDVPADADLPFA